MWTTEINYDHNVSLLEHFELKVGKNFCLRAFKIFMKNVVTSSRKELNKFLSAHITRHTVRSALLDISKLSY